MNKFETWYEILDIVHCNEKCCQSRTSWVTVFLGKIHNGRLFHGPRNEIAQNTIYRTLKSTQRKLFTENDIDKQLHQKCSWDKMRCTQLESKCNDFRITAKDELLTFQFLKFQWNISTKCCNDTRKYFVGAANKITDSNNNIQLLTFCLSNLTFSPIKVATLILTPVISIVLNHAFLFLFLLDTTIIFLL